MRPSRNPPRPERWGAANDLRILILSWRDPKNPKAGGAETFTYEVARRLVAAGDSVEWFVAAFPGSLREETLDGVRIVREGRQWSVHWHAFRRYRARLRGCFDTVIDEVNTIPFLTPLWADIPTYMLIFQLAREVWWYESRFPLSAIGYALEPLYLRAYRDVPVFTISDSTVRDLRRLGYRGPISVIPVGIEPVSPRANHKTSVPTFVYVGRLAPSKRIDDLIRALATFREATGEGRLQLVGDGDLAYRRRLLTLATKLGVESCVEFCGRLSAEAKHSLMAESHALVMASAREGWGLVVTEANACGTPAVVYDVSGLRDSVRNGETGLVVAPTPNRLADGMLQLWKDRELYRRISEEAERWSHTFSFDVAAQLLREGLTACLRP